MILKPLARHTPIDIEKLKTSYSVALYPSSDTHLGMYMLVSFSLAEKRAKKEKKKKKKRREAVGGIVGWYQ